MPVRLLSSAFAVISLQTGLEDVPPTPVNQVAPLPLTNNLSSKFPRFVNVLQKGGGGAQLRERDERQNDEKAAIVVGGPNTGKSTTIREFKAMVKMQSFHIFSLIGEQGYILSTSFEEAGRDVDSAVGKLSGYYFLVLACQGRQLKEAKRALQAASFSVGEVHTVLGEPIKQARKQAKSVYKFLKSN
jgi:hypothetical protein